MLRQAPFVADILPVSLQPHVETVPRGRRVIDSDIQYQILEVILAQNNPKQIREISGQEHQWFQRA